MGRVIKLFIYYLLYTFAFTGIFSGGYMIANHTLEFPQSDATVFQLTMWAQVLSTLAVGVHLLVWKYVKRDQLSLSFPNAGKVMLASIILIVGMGCWTNYLTELTGLPDTMEEIFTKAMYNPLGVISIVVMAPIVEELLFRGGMQSHLLRKWKSHCGRTFVPRRNAKPLVTQMEESRLGDSGVCPYLRYRTWQSRANVFRFHPGIGTGLGILPHRKPVALHVDALYQ